MDALSIGAAGMSSAVNQFNVSAIQAVSGTGDPAQQAVSQMQAKTEFQASAAVVKTADQMMGSLLDIMV